MKSKSICILLLFICIIPVFGQVQKDTTALSTIILQGSPIKVSIQNTSASVSVIGIKDLEKTDGVILTSVLNKIPGLYMQQGALNTNRITIRGIGARTQYGTSKIKAYFENIPLTSGEGETVIEDIDIATIGRIEIIKGPNSTSFGSGLGGVIHLTARTTPFDDSFGKTTTTYGSFGLLKQSIAAGLSNSKSNLFTNYTNLQTDGFRSNSGYDRKSFNLNGKQEISSNGSLSFLGVFTRLKAFIPSSISEKNFINNPEKAAPTWEAAKGYESYDKLILGIGYNHKLSKKWTFDASAFSNFKKGNEARPFNILNDKTSSFGFRTSLNYKDLLFLQPFEISLGSEHMFDKYSYSLFGNLYLSHPGQGSITGAEFSSIGENRNYSNYYLQAELQLITNLYLETGIAINTTKYSLEDLFQQSNSSQRSHYTFGKILSPRLGLSYKLSQGKNIYASVSKGFAIPTIAESLNPDGTINTSLKPEMGWNYELGFKGNWLDTKLRTELTFFSTQITNQLVARRTADDQYVGINAGESSHKGVEIMINYTLIEKSNWQIDSYFSGAFNNFKFINFIDSGSDYSGNSITGVPNSQWNLGIDLNTKMGFRLNTSYRNWSRIPMNDQNTKYSDAYRLLDFKIAYAFNILKVIKAELSSGINNALNEHYAASILPNAVGFGSAAPRYYYPGNPRNYYVGFAVSYHFL
ncbi:TonB-dependent receptor family protein [Flavobacterium cellulosilyticum]|uniref:TonB-dependent receptor n=1 Tax=Flavobacterium cellulosilyticum TaxID=2541731 RepID=A0A4V2YYW0_9FLAO|nr:TonB-dependent receptor [Flavobacterium cellulosilyticum]TDD94717.1 TonB-dependent receptor [Flavobacterium cellulosilyticum]